MKGSNGHTCRSEKCLEQRTLLKENALEERVLVSEHQAFFGGGAVRRLKVVQVGLMDANGLLELLDIFGASFAKGGLGLSVALFALLRGCIDLFGQKHVSAQEYRLRL